MQQFFKFDKQWFKQDLSNDERVCLMVLVDRMQLSMKNNMYYDQSHQSYFITYSQQSMANLIGVSLRTINKIYKHLSELGIIERKKRFNASDVIFLNVNAKCARKDVQDMQPNKNELNKSITSDTVKTTQSNKIEHWKQAVVSKTKLPELAVDTILKFTHNDLSKAYAIVGTINKAKKNVARKYRLLNSPVSRFECNTNIQRQITSKLAYLFNYADKVNNMLAYIKKGMQTFFIDAFGVKKDELITPHSQSQSKTIDIKKPSWMNEEYDQEKDKLSEQSKREVERLLEEFEKGRVNFA